jgi:hypothetical protein
MVLGMPVIRSMTVVIIPVNHHQSVDLMIQNAFFKKHVHVKTIGKIMVNMLIVPSSFETIISLINHHYPILSILSVMQVVLIVEDHIMVKGVTNI